jgi:hypothetical protein
VTELSWSICYGPLIWYACTGGAVLHCAACGHITVTGNWNEPEHMYAEILREGVA